MKKYFLAGIVAAAVIAALIFSFNSQAKTSADGNISVFTVATYNVENLFDMEPNGTEYPEYIPNFKGWDKRAHDIKLENIAKVIKDMNAEVVALEEVENENALNELLKKLKSDGVEYPYYAITKNSKTAVQSALISKFKIISYDELKLNSQYRERPILKARLSIGKDELIVYVNHWKAKTGPESKRVEFANLLVQDIKKLPIDADFLVLGDMNSNYNEMETFINDKKLNDTNGVAAINHILKTAKSKPGEKPELASKADVMANQKGEYLYNLWNEIPKYERVSEWFGKDRNTPDNIIIPKAMFDKKGISYVDGSFKVFSPAYLLKNGRPYRWEMGSKTKELSIPQGYSDHLPILAKFRVGGFEPKDEPKAKAPVKTAEKTISDSGIKTVSIADIYKSGSVADVLIKNAVVIYRHFDAAIIKQRNGRAIFVYNAPQEMKVGGIYDIRVAKAEDYHGLKEIKQIIDYRLIGQTDVSSFILKDAEDLTDLSIQNEIVGGLGGIFSKGKFLYKDGKEIKIYFKDKSLKPKNLSRLTLKTAHIGFYNEPQIVIYSKDDFEIIE
jgi:endonuclease/exonuclease/phosphatase family metal-dependent hydrolase